MKVSAVYIIPYRYDYFYLRLCVASIRYWYPAIDIFLIKDRGYGHFSTRRIANAWNLKELRISRKKLGWGYGKMEALFQKVKHSYLAMDTDTVVVGPILETLQHLQADFVVDEEVQGKDDFNRLYYNLDRVEEIDPSFKYPGYSFNCGQYFGTAGKLNRKDFEKVLDWTEPPTSKYPGIIYFGDQSAFNFMIHWWEQQKRIVIARKKIMIWPAGNRAEFIDINQIKNKGIDFPYILHYAGLKFDSIKDFPRADILRFYEEFYYSRVGLSYKYVDRIYLWYLKIERKIKAKFLKV